jgi:hypothetical protein
MLNARVIDGKTKFFQLVNPPDGNHPNFKAKTLISSRPTQKSGALCPKIAKTPLALATKPFGLRADIVPRIIAKVIEINKATNPNNMVFRSAGKTNSVTGCWYRKLSPKFPRIAPFKKE